MPTSLELDSWKDHKQIEANQILMSLWNFDSLTLKSELISQLDGNLMSFQSMRSFKENDKLV